MFWGDTLLGIRLGYACSTKTASTLRTRYRLQSYTSCSLDHANTKSAELSRRCHRLGGLTYLFSLVSLVPRSPQAEDSRAVFFLPVYTNYVGEPINRSKDNPPPHVTAVRVTSKNKNKTNNKNKNINGDQNREQKQNRQQQKQNKRTSTRTKSNTEQKQSKEETRNNQRNNAACS